MRQSEFKRKYDPEIGKYKKQHIWGGEISEVSKKNQKTGKICSSTIITTTPTSIQKSW